MSAGAESDGRPARLQRRQKELHRETGYRGNAANTVAITVCEQEMLVHAVEPHAARVAFACLRQADGDLRPSLIGATGAVVRNRHDERRFGEFHRQTDVQSLAHLRHCMGEAVVNERLNAEPRNAYAATLAAGVKLEIELVGVPVPLDHHVAVQVANLTRDKDRVAGVANGAVQLNGERSKRRHRPVGVGSGRESYDRIEAVEQEVWAHCRLE